MTDAAVQEQLARLQAVYPEGHVPVESLAACQAQRDAWAAAFSSLAESVLGGVFYLYDVREDSGGSSFLCDGCGHDGDGWPHEEWCHAFLMSELPEALTAKDQPQ